MRAVPSQLTAARHGPSSRARTSPGSRSSTAELHASVIAYFDDVLGRHGLRREKGSFYVWRISDGFDGWMSPSLTRRAEWGAHLDIGVLVQ